MVRALACHARGRRFDTDHSRQLTTLFKPEVVIRMVNVVDWLENGHRHSAA